MGYRGKLEEQARARELRAAGWTMPEIATHLGVSRSSVSLWTRDVPVDAAVARSPRSGRRLRGSEHPLRKRKLAEIAELTEQAVSRVGAASSRDLLVAGLALYAGDGSKTGGSVRFANSDPRMVAFHCAWLRSCFDIDEARLRVRLYLHHGLDLDAATAHWSTVTGVPVDQFTKPYRAVPDASIRHNKHRHGCAHVIYSCARTSRAVLAQMDALLGAVVGAVPHDEGGPAA